MKKIIDFLIKIFWIFVIGSVFGFIIEMLYILVYTRTIEIRQGLIYGPFAPVYGLGTVAFYLVLPKIKNIFNVFLASAVLGGVTEYLCSFFQEKLFGTISWDYSDLFMNINGRTSLTYCILWGILGVVFIKLIYPYIEKLFDKMNMTVVKKFVTALAVIFMIFNISISSLAARRQYERREHIAPENEIDEFLDEHYPDEFMNKVYANKIEK